MVEILRVRERVRDSAHARARVHAFVCVCLRFWSRGQEGLRHITSWLHPLNPHPITPFNTFRRCERIARQPPDLEHLVSPITFPPATFPVLSPSSASPSPSAALSPQSAASALPSPPPPPLLLLARTICNWQGCPHASDVPCAYFLVFEYQSTLSADPHTPSSTLFPTLTRPPLLRSRILSAG